MKTRVLYFAMIAAALTFSCQKAELENNDVVDNGTNNEVVDFVPGPGKILAVSPTGTETKIAFGEEVDGKYPVVWTNNDAIKVYSENNTEGVVYTYTTEATEGVSSAVFTGDPVEGETRYAVFPATRAYGFEDGKLKISFDALKKQDYHTSIQANGSNLKYMPMWATEGEGDDAGKFSFENLCGVVSFRFNDYQELRGMKITSVKIASASKYISGVATLDPADGSFTLAAESTKNPDGDKEIVVRRESGLEIANTKTNPSISDTGVKGFLIGLPIGEYPAGDLTITMTDSFGRVFTRTVNSPLTVLPGVDKTFKTLSFTFAYGEANCHNMKKSTSLTFDAAMRYTFGKSLAVTDMELVKGTDGNNFDGGESYKVKVLWEKADGADAFVANSVLSSVAYDDNKITVTAGANNGNALVALYTTDEDNNEIILWSWHIWVSDLQTLTYTKCVDQGTPQFHDRNLGATTNGYDKKTSIGLYYQYGRKDPFVIKNDVTGTNGLVEGVELTYRTERTDDVARVSWTIKNPLHRIIYVNASEPASGRPARGFNDWLKPSAEVETYWGNTANTAGTVDACNAAKDGYKTIYDPCPSGYRVPDYFYFTGLGTAAEGTGDSAKGIKFYYAASSDTKYTVYPLPGTLNTEGEGIFHYGYTGSYWTTTLTDNSAIGFIYSSSTFHTSTIGSRTVRRPAAANIRCLKIQ